MKHLFARLGRDRRGVSAIEFAIVAPVLILMIVGVVQMGAFFYAHAGLRSAVSDGARFATIYPRSTEAEVSARVVDSLPAATPGTFSEPRVTFQLNAASGTWTAQVAMDYTATFNMIVYSTTRTLTYTRQANVNAPPAAT